MPFLLFVNALEVIIIILKDLLNLKTEANNIRISTKDWIPIESVQGKGVLLKNGTVVKILEVEPINFELKSDFEKTAVLNGYKRFLKTCNFDMQIVVQTQVTDISKHLTKMKKFAQEDEKLSEMVEDYINFANEVVTSKKNVSRKFYIVIKGNNNMAENISKIKECLLAIRKYSTWVYNWWSYINNEKLL